MLRKLRPRSIYDVMAAIACFGVLAGGTAYAANTIGSTDIIDGQVKSADVKDQSLTTFDVSTFLGVDIVSPDGFVSHKVDDRGELVLDAVIQLVQKGSSLQCGRIG